MKKCLLLAALALFVLPFGLRAQNSFDLETDTACVGQLIHLKPHTMNASNYYWGFCSGYLQTLPIASNLGSTFQFNSPSGIELARDGANYYGFVINAAGNQLLRLNFGAKLSNTPTVTNFGSLDTTVSPSPNSMYLTQDSGKWFLFVCGGGGPVGTPSTLSRFDFGNTLANVPNGVRMGNIGGLLNDPQGIFVAREGDVYYGFVVNAGNDVLIRLNFGKNISRTPTATNLGNIGFLAAPNDIAPVYDQGSWYFFIPNTRVGFGGGYSVTRLFFGNTLSNTPVGSNPTINAPGNTSDLNIPSAISIIKDCGSYYAFITNRGNNSVLRVPMPNLKANAYTPLVVANTGFSSPEDISRVVRDRDSLYAFVVNNGNNSLSRLLFPQCHDANIQSSTSAIPPAYKYDTAGIFNIFLAVNEGLPNMAMDCKQIVVLNIPPITISHDTSICQGVVLPLFVNSQNAVNYFFTPNYNIGDTQGRLVYVYPEQSTDYHIRIPFYNGCVVDTVVKVDVSRVRADAGPDRTIFDGAKTVIGGPNTLTGANFTYEWFPTTFLSDPFNYYTTVNPQRSITYYLKVTNTDRCVDIDTVNIKVTCNGFNLPNAFSPDNLRGAPRTYGLLNRQVEQLNYFRIFDRWGHQVFSTTDATKEWDGTYNGEPAPFGVYVWEADGFCEVTQERLHSTGNVTLIR